MIYILVNNQYHIYDLNLWADQFEGKEVCLIQIPHNLQPIYSDTRFSKIFLYEPYYNGLKSLIKFHKIFEIHRSINNEIKPKSTDILILYTEFELLNQYIVEKFYKAGCKIWLLEDGLATMTLFNLDKYNRDFKTRISTILLKYFYRYKYLDIIKCPDPTPIMSDYLFTGVCVKIGNSIKRDIELYNYINNIRLINEDLDNKKVIFLNNDLYNFFCDYNDYLNILKDSLNNICQKFDTVYFKFHPRETDDYITKISIELKKFSNIIIIDKSQIIEESIMLFSPKYAVSFVSAALINLYFLGVEPIFLFNIHEQLRKDKFVTEIESFLKSINYNLISSYEQINDDYHSDIQIKNTTMSLRDIVLG